MIASKFYKASCTVVRVESTLLRVFSVSKTARTFVSSPLLSKVMDGSHKLGVDGHPEDFNLLLKELLKLERPQLPNGVSNPSETDLNLGNINTILTKLMVSGFFETGDLESLQMFLEWADLAWLSAKVQTKLYRCLMLFLNESKYSVLIKHGVCMQVLELVERNPSHLRVAGLYEFPIHFMFDRCATLGLHEMITLYTKGQCLKLFREEECAFLEERVLEELTFPNKTTPMTLQSFPQSIWLEFAVYVAVQRYRQLGQTSESLRCTPYSSHQVQLLQQVLGWISLSKRWETRLSLRK